MFDERVNKTNLNAVDSLLKLISEKILNAIQILWNCQKSSEKNYRCLTLNYLSIILNFGFEIMNFCD